MKINVYNVIETLLLLCTMFISAILGYEYGYKMGKHNGWEMALKIVEFEETAKQQELQRQAERFCPESRIGGGYCDGKFVYLKDLK